jgi:hypothetical protein
MHRLGPVTPSYSLTDFSRHSRREAHEQMASSATTEAPRSHDARSFAGILERMIAR